MGDVNRTEQTLDAVRISLEKLLFCFSLDVYLPIMRKQLFNGLIFFLKKGLKAQTAK